MSTIRVTAGLSGYILKTAPSSIRLWNTTTCQSLAVRIELPIHLIDEVVDRLIIDLAVVRKRIR